MSLTQEQSTTRTQDKSTTKHRTKGEQTKKLILNAAIEVLAQNGIKGTTHRAVANQANIQLSLTTYYFKDIHELVHQAFQLNSEQVTEEAGSAWRKAFQLLDDYDKTSLRKVSVREKLCAELAQISTQYLTAKIINQPVSLAVEQLLFTEIQVTPALRALARQHKELLITPFIRLCRYFNKQDPETTADIMLTMFTQLEYRNLPLASESIDEEEIRAVTRRLIAWMMGLKK